MDDKNTAPRVYKTWHNDSTRWEYYTPRNDDVVIATYAKCGTTWTQRIISLLIFQSPEPCHVHEVSPWVDSRLMFSIEQLQTVLNGQQHRRFLKSHIPFDGLPHYDQVRYIHVARDARDTCMSFFNHCSAYTPLAYQGMDQAAGDMGGPAPRCPDDPRTFWRDWMTRGVMPGATDGYPDLSFFDFETTYWQARHTDNLLLVHYNDLKADLDGEMRRIADFLSIKTPPDLWPQLVEAATFAAMKREGEELLPGMENFFEGGVDRFLFEGSNGRWHDIMTADDLALYEQAAARWTPSLTRWLENGRLAGGDPRTTAD